MNQAQSQLKLSHLQYHRVPLTPGPVTPYNSKIKITKPKYQIWEFYRDYTKEKGRLLLERQTAFQQLLSQSCETQLLKYYS